MKAGKESIHGSLNDLLIAHQELSSLLIKEFNDELTQTNN